ncbi:MAG: hemin uptake protein HemP [Sphingobacteriia bacterium]|nr:hemin uptake protein HemP [Sphingobacteriia bacterium]
MSAAVERVERVERVEHHHRSLPGSDPQDTVYSAELFDPAGELRVLHRGRLYRLRVARAGHLELLGPKGLRSARAL